MKQKTKEAKRLLQDVDNEVESACDNCKHWFKEIGPTSSIGHCTKNEMISRYDYRCGNWEST